MKDILINYPIKILQQELINIRTSYRLEKKRIIEILKDMKSIKKLTKEELIDLLIKYNYDISKLPKLEDLIKPKKERKPRAKKEPKPKAKKEPKPKAKELLKRKEELLKLKLEEERMIKYWEDFKLEQEQIKKEKQKEKEEEEKQKQKELKIEEAKKELENIKLEKERKEFKKDKLFNMDDEQSLNRYNAVKNRDLKFTKGIINELINTTKRIITYKKEILTSTRYDYFLNLKRLIESYYKEINRFEIILAQKLEEEEKKELDKLKLEKEEPKFMIKKNKVSPDDYIKMKDDFKSNTYEWAKQAYKEGFTDTEILSYSSIGETDYKLLNAFFTPNKIIKDMLDYSYLYENLRLVRSNGENPSYILECSGGIGNIIYYILEAINYNDNELLKYIKIDFVEINKDFIEIAKAKLDKYKDIITYHNMSFFNFKTDNEYDFIFGNPPYKMTINNKNIYDVDFFIKCWDLLSFKIIFLMSPSSLTLKTNSHKRFKEIIDNQTEEELINYNKLFIYKNEFKDKKTTQAGQTGITTNLYILDKNN